MIEQNLAGKVIAVTGAGGRLGAQVVHRFAQQGATIAAIVQNEDEVHSIPFPEGAEGWAFPADVTDEAMVEACFGQIGNQFGHVDVLVHTVGGWDGRPFLETSEADWSRILRLNLTSAFLCFREAARLMEGGGGQLIAIASAQGADRGRAEQAAYSAAKAGVVRLVESVAAEFSDRGITAHAIAPSTILFEGTADQPGVPVHHLVDLCMYLCTDAGAAHNGTVLRAYGSQQ